LNSYHPFHLVKENYRKQTEQTETFAQLVKFFILWSPIWRRKSNYLKLTH